MDSPADRRRAFIAPALAGSAAAAGGAMLGGVLTQTIGWRLVFLTGVPVALAAVAAAPRLLPGGASQSQPVRLDAGAALLSTSGLVLLVFGITNLERAGARPLITALALTAGCGLLVAFLVRERRTPFPLLRPSLHGIRSLRIALLGMPGQVFAYTGSTVIGLLFLQRASGYPALDAGLGVAPLGVAAALGSLSMALVFSLRDWTRTVALSLLVCAVGLLMLATAPVHGGYLSSFLPGFVLVGLGAATAAVTLNASAGSEVPVGDRGVAYGLFETSTHVSGPLVVALLVTVAAAAARSSSSTATAGALAVGYRAAFLVAAAGVLVAAALTRLLGRASAAQDLGAQAAGFSAGATQSANR